MSVPDWKLVELVRDFFHAHRSLHYLIQEYRAGSLHFDDVASLVGSSDSSVLFRLKERCPFLNGYPVRTDAEFVPYWMHHAIRGHENPALDARWQRFRAMGLTAYARDRNDAAIGVKAPASRAPS